jgi:hypothetical protein
MEDELMMDRVRVWMLEYKQDTNIEACRQEGVVYLKWTGGCIRHGGFTPVHT